MTLNLTFDIFGKEARILKKKDRAKHKGSSANDQYCRSVIIEFSAARCNFLYNWNQILLQLYWKNQNSDLLREEVRIIKRKTSQAINYL